MIDKKIYELMKKKYYNVSSWAVWADELDTPKSNMGNLSVFDDPKICSVLNTGYVFVGLNVSGTEVNKNVHPWRNFHSDKPQANDYRLRKLFRDTEFWGSYMTDIIKFHAETDGSQVMKYIKENPDFLEENICSFKTEIGYLGDKPILVAMGDKAYKILARHLGNEYTVLMIKHVTQSTLTFDEYKEECMSILRSKQNMVVKNKSEKNYELPFS